MSLHQSIWSASRDEGRGGVAPSMELFTNAGPRPASELVAGDMVFALEPTTRLVKPKRVVEVTRRSTTSGIIRASARRVGFELAPQHPIPHTTPRGEVRFTPLVELLDADTRRLINDWRIPSRSRTKMFDITELLSRFNISFEARMSHPGPLDHIRARLPDDCTPHRYNKWDGTYQFVFEGAVFNRYQAAIETLGDTCHIHGQPNQWWRPYRFDATRFARFLGWFIAEGSTWYDPKTETAEVSVAQRSNGHRAHIEALLSDMGLNPSRSECAIGFASQLYAKLLDRLCGSDSYEKRLPSLTWSLPRRLRRVLLDTLMAGDGNFSSKQYYTASKQLRDDVCRLAMSLGVKPRYFPSGGDWTVSLRRTRDQLHGRQLECEPTDRNHVRLVVEDYPVVLAGRNGKYQWLGVSQVV